MKKIFLLLLLLSVISNTGCTIQKLIDNAMNTLLPVQVVSGTITLPAESNFSGTNVSFKGKQTVTDSKGAFSISVSQTSAKSFETMNTDQMTIAHTGYATENVDVPAENESGEYAISKTLNLTNNVGYTQNPHPPTILIQQTYITVTINVVENKKYEITTNKADNPNNNDNRLNMIRYVFIMPTESTYIIYFDENAKKVCLDGEGLSNAPNYHFPNAPKGLVWSIQCKGVLKYILARANEPVNFNVWFLKYPDYIF